MRVNTLAHQSTDGTIMVRSPFDVCCCFADRLDGISVHPYRPSIPETVIDDFTQLRKFVAAVSELKLCVSNYMGELILICTSPTYAFFRSRVRVRIGGIFPYLSNRNPVGAQLSLHQSDSLSIFLEVLEQVQLN